MSMKVGVVGGGGFGVALAAAIARRGNDALLWSRHGKDDARFSTTVEERDLVDRELVFLAVPSTHVPSVTLKLAAHLDGRHLLVHVSRGLIGDCLQTVSQHFREHSAVRRVGALAGPLSPEIFAEDLPGAGVVGSLFPEVGAAVREAIGCPNLRLYHTPDATGVEVASALAGLLAVATGFCLEKKIGPSATALMLNRGVAEAARVGVKLGGREATFHGMAGAGDVIAAIAGDERPEVRLGRALGRGESGVKAAKAASANVESLELATRVSEYADRIGIDAPIATVMARFINGEVGPEEGLTELMST